MYILPDELSKTFSTILQFLCNSSFQLFLPDCKHCSYKPFLVLHQTIYFHIHEEILKNGHTCLNHKLDLFPHHFDYHIQQYSVLQEHIALFGCIVPFSAKDCPLYTFQYKVYQNLYPDSPLQSALLSIFPAFPIPKKA